MKCVYMYYQSKRSSHCTECVGQEVSHEPILFVNNLLQMEGDHPTNNQWKFVDKRSFSTFYNGEQNNTVLKFKYTPPTTSELLDGQSPKADGQINYKSHSRLHQYLNFGNQNHKPRTSLKSSRNFPIFGDFYLNSNSLKTLIVSAEKDRGRWCVYSGSSTCSSNKTKLHSTPEFKAKTCSGRTLNLKESMRSAYSKRSGGSTFTSALNQKYDMQSLKRKYNITNYHRGKWLISSKERSRCLWREICKLISSKDLVHCNAKYQEMMKEIWIYCDFSDSLDAWLYEAWITLCGG
ncbi:uncharacterized protein LOC116304712 isoform X2 [Actinia tenebrosa]|uniref:Uncharacterized protein LOC116304712 isoform X2 n=1 Tax=Actinia tenebrosa TaxID=6105 RepID=A0A6P8IWE7_ACTTE|nr:uncharacterized protein LOC116304712 isoform X2 [Actinia tenebrosa]